MTTSSSDLATGDDDADGARTRLAREIRRLRQAADLSQKDLARQTGYTRAYVGQAESGQLVPSKPLVSALDRALNAKGDLVALRARAVLAQRARREHLSRSIEDPGGRDAENRAVADVAVRRSLAQGEVPAPGPWEIGSREEDDDMRRRAALGITGTAVVAGLASTLEPVRRGVDSALGFPTTAQDADEWERVAYEYSRLVDRVPAGEVIPQLLVDLDEARIRAEAANDTLRPRLVRTCALLSGLAAMSLVGAGQWQEAGRYWRTAQRAAGSAGDPELFSLISGRRAVFGTYNPNGFDSALGFADDAVDAGGAGASAGKASGLAARAQVLALRGDRSGASTALLELERTFDDLPERTRADCETVWGWSEHRLHHVRSFVHSYNGDVAQATDAQDTMLSMYQSPSWGAALVRFHQAACMIVAGDPSQGARHAAQVFESARPEFRGGLIRTSAVFALERVPEDAKRLPMVREARELVAGSPLGA